jgi:(S)-ureidoglycine aminohydrolase
MNHSAVSRSSIQRNHALITPESHVQSSLPGWRNAKGIILIGPPLGAGFVQYLALLESGAVAGPPPGGVSRFLFVLDGAVTVEAEGERQSLQPGDFAYLPPDAPALIQAPAAGRLLVFEKPYQPQAGESAPPLVVGHEQAIEPIHFLGDPAALLKYLLPNSPAFDFEINLFCFELNQAAPCRW